MMSKYRIIWLPVIQRYVQFLKEDNSEYWHRDVLFGAKNIDLMPIHLIAIILLSIAFPVKIIKIRGE